MAETRYGLLVKDIKILACRQGVDWWLTFRSRFEPSGRVIPIPGTATPQGDHAWVLCGDPVDGSDSRAEAQELLDLMVANGVHKAALKVQRTPKEVTDAR